MLIIKQTVTTKPFEFQFKKFQFAYMYTLCNFQQNANSILPVRYCKLQEYTNDNMTRKNKDCSVYRIRVI
jgi:hypothetical protein